MRALTWQGKEEVSVETVDDPKIIDPTDAIVRITSTAICGSDLHLYDGVMPAMKKGDVLGHENMGEVVAVGSAVTKLRPGDRVVVPFTISCGTCYFCERELWSLCDRSNPNAEMAAKIMGQSPAGLYGYSHLTGGFWGGQAEYLRVPYADHGPYKVDSSLPDEKLLFLSDIFPTGYMAAENCDIEPGATVAVWGCGPVGQFAIRSAFMLGAGRVIAIDHIPERLQMAEAGGAETINFGEQKVMDTLMDMTGIGPDACIDAVGTEAHEAGSIDSWVDRAKQAVKLENDRGHALREAIKACRKGGTVSVPGVYVGMLDHFPAGPMMNKALTIKTGQTHVQRYFEPLMERIENGEIDPSFVITHTLPLDQAPDAYRKFRDKEDGYIKVVLKPQAKAA